MIIYFAIIFAILIMSIALRNQNTSSELSYKKIYVKDVVILFAIGAILIMVAGLRYNVGADYLQYAANYRAYYMSDLEILGEPGIRIVAKIAHASIDHFGMMFLLASVITIGCYYWSILTNSPYFIISILLFILLGCWHESFNSVRQSLAAGILFLGHTSIKEKKIVKWIIVCCVASLFHISAIIFVFLYFLPVKRVTFKYIIIFSVCAFFMLNQYEHIWELISFLQGEEFLVDIYSQSRINVLRILVAWVPTLFYLVFQKIYILQDERYKTQLHFYLSFSILNACIMMSAMNSAYLGRMGIYMELYNTLCWAYLLKPLTKNRGNIVFFVIFFLVYGIYWYAEVSGEYLANFQWIFSVM